MWAWALIGCGPAEQVDGPSLALPDGAAASAPLAIPSPALPLPKPALSSGPGGSCFVTTDGAPGCWGPTNAGGDLAPSKGPFVDIAKAKGFTCGLRADGSLACWGDTTPPTGEFVAIEGADGMCALTRAGALVCWAMDAPAIGPGPFAALAMDEGRGCALRAADGVAECWGDPQIAPPTGAFTAIDVGRHTACGLRTSGVISCWGSNLYGYGNTGRSEPPAGPFTALVVGEERSCAIDAAGAATCWPDIGDPLRGVYSEGSVAGTDGVFATPDGSIVRGTMYAGVHPAFPTADVATTDLLFLADAVPPNPDWVEFAPMNAGFSVLMPIAPSPGARGTWTATPPIGERTFEIILVPNHDQPADAALDAWVATIPANKPDYELLASSSEAVDGHPARRLYYRGKGQRERVLAVADGTHLVVASAVWRDDAVIGNATERFLASLQLRPWDPTRLIAPSP
jgi:hypothetical protein